LSNKNEQRKEPTAGFVACSSASVSILEEISDQFQGLDHRSRKKRRLPNIFGNLINNRYHGEW
jgi:hypothetical protein